MRTRSSWIRAIPLLIVVALLVAWRIVPGGAEATAAKTQAKTATAVKKASATAGMSHYIVISPHTAEECLASLDAVEAMPNGKAELARWDWGCKSGDHTGYLLVSANSSEEALAHVPESLRANAKAVKLNKFTPEQLKEAHEAHGENVPSPSATPNANSDTKKETNTEGK